MHQIIMKTYVCNQQKYLIYIFIIDINYFLSINLVLTNINISKSYDLTTHSSQIMR